MHAQGENDLRDPVSVGLFVRDGASSVKADTVRGLALADQFHGVRRNDASANPKASKLDLPRFSGEALAHSAACFSN